MELLLPSSYVRTTLLAFLQMRQLRTRHEAAPPSRGREAGTEKEREINGGRAFNLASLGRAAEEREGEYKSI